MREKVTSGRKQGMKCDEHGRDGKRDSISHSEPLFAHRKVELIFNGRSLSQDFRENLYGSFLSITNQHTHIHTHTKWEALLNHKMQGNDKIIIKI